MIAPLQTPPQAIVYPDSDGQPMADNTLQFEWIVFFKDNTEILLADNPNVFVAGDLLWYPVEGDPKIRMAPDLMVVFGRPKGYRGSYKQWEEDGIPPQVVAEVLSPGNTLKEMARKLEFYDQYGVEEYYLFDPYKNDLSGWLRSKDGRLRVIETLDGWISPRLQIRFDLSGEPLRIWRADGDPYLNSVEREAQRQRERQRALQAEQERNQAQQERDEARRRAEALAQRLRDLGVDPDTP
ncbi:MAG: Uma2 family endonuclease [Thermostichus sp. BF3_bins_97]